MTGNEKSDSKVKLPADQYAGLVFISWTMQTSYYDNASVLIELKNVASVCCGEWSTRDTAWVLKH